MTDVLSGDGVRDLFQGFLKKHSLDRCISIKFVENGNGATLNMVAESTEVADYWVRGLQKLISNKGKCRQNKSDNQYVGDGVGLDQENLPGRSKKLRTLLNQR